MTAFFVQNASCSNVSVIFVAFTVSSLFIAVSEEDLKKRIAEELALEHARRDADTQKRFVLRINCSLLLLFTVL